MTPRRAVELHAGARILTNHGLLLVMHLEHHGVRVQDALGVKSSISYDALIAAQVGDGGVQAVHSSLEPWWSGLTVDTRANALFRQEVVLEVLTGYRDGHPELAQDGEPFFPFGTGYGTSIRQRCEAMAEQVSFERSVDRAVMRRVREAELVTGRVHRQSIYLWVTAWGREGLRGLVDGRKTKGKQGFEVLDPRFLRIADEEFAAFDGGISAVNQEEIERRILVRLKQEGITDAHLPQRLTQEYLSNRHTALGRTTRAHRSNAQRAVGPRSSRWCRPGRPSRTRLTHPSCGGIGGNPNMPARSTSNRAIGAAPVVRTTRAFARVSQWPNWVLKSAGEANDRPGMNEVSNHPSRRSTIPLDSGSLGGNSTSLVANVPMNDATPPARRCPRPIPGSLSHNNRRGTAPSCWISSHDPNSKSSVLRVGTIRPTTNRECAATITNTGNSFRVPSSTAIFFGGNHRSHCAASPGAQTKRSAGSTGRCSGRNCFTFSRNQRIDPSHPTRSASTVEGMSGVSLNNARTRGATTVNDVGPDARSYRGGACEFTALMTVVREIPNRSAIRAFGTPSPASLLISAQSSKVITLQSLSVHFSPPKLSSFRAPPTAPSDVGTLSAPNHQRSYLACATTRRAELGKISTGR